MDNCDTILRLAEQFRDSRQWSEADRLFAQVVATEPTTAMHIAFGVYLAERQNYPAAIRQLMLGLDGAKAEGDLSSQELVYSNLAAIFRELGDADLAQRFQRRVLAIEDSAGPMDLLAWSQDALLAGRLEVAEKLARNALQLAQDAEDISLQADSWGAIALIAARQGKLRLAIRLLIRAIRGHDFIGDDRGSAIDLQNLAEICGLVQRFHWQRAFFGAAQDRFREVGMPRSESRVQSRLRDVDRLERYRRMEAGWN
jgi:tetratricopeptide (TPR) repeat protein